MVDVIGSIVISLSHCCLPNDEGPAPSPPYFLLEPPCWTPAGSASDWSCVCRCVWLLVLVISLAAFVYCTVNCVYDYTSSHSRRPTVMSQPRQHHQQLDAAHLHLPTITFCNLNPIRSHSAETLLTCSPQFTPRIPAAYLPNSRNLIWCHLIQFSSI